MGLQRSEWGYGEPERRLERPAGDGAGDCQSDEFGRLRRLLPVSNRAWRSSSGNGRNTILGGCQHLEHNHGDLRWLGIQQHRHARLSICDVQLEGWRVVARDFAGTGLRRIGKLDRAQFILFGALRQGCPIFLLPLHQANLTRIIPRSGDAPCASRLPLISWAVQFLAPLALPRSPRSDTVANSFSPRCPRFSRCINSPKASSGSASREGSRLP